MRLATLLLLTTLTAHAQWELEDSHTKADLRGIDNVGNGVAWTSGSNGTILRTTDGGEHWQLCPVPPEAAKLDFRAIQAFNANTAIVMSSGKGDLSRLYKTTDACQTWTPIATNPEKEGLFDAIQTETDGLANDPGPSPERAMILGDSVDHKIQIWEWKEGWEDRELELYYGTKAKMDMDETSFAASNSVLQVVSTSQADVVWKYALRWSSGTATHAYISMVRDEQTPTCEPCREELLRVEVPMSQSNATAGVFSFAFRNELIGVAVGGNFKKPAATNKTAAFTTDAGNSWKLAQKSPHGFRSSVAYDAPSKIWITVGPNGTDISRDDGKNWLPLKPYAGDSPNANKNWNALSLPYVVGPNGRIGKLRPTALNPR